jgi:hypothetical protein
MATPRRITVAIHVSMNIMRLLINLIAVEE